MGAISGSGAAAAAQPRGKNKGICSLISVCSSLVSDRVPQPPHAGIMIVLFWRLRARPEPLRRRHTRNPESCQLDSERVAGAGPAEWPTPGTQTSVRTRTRAGPEPMHEK